MRCLEHDVQVVKIFGNFVFLHHQIENHLLLSRILTRLLVYFFH